MAQTDIYKELKDALQALKDFLAQNTAVIKPVIQPLAQLLPQITDLINSLIDLMNKLKTAIQNINLNALPGGANALAKLSAFTQMVKALLDAIQPLLPADQAADIQKVRQYTDVVTGLPSIDQVKQDILTLIDAIVADLTSLKPA